MAARTKFKFETEEINNKNKFEKSIICWSKTQSIKLYILSI